MPDAVRRVAIALGSNLGDRDAALLHARAAMSALPGLVIAAQSSVEETAPLDGAVQPAYLNQMLLVQTAMPLPELLVELQRIEREHGRERIVAKGPRTLDIDIVWAEDVTITSDALLVPHPGLFARAFWHRGLEEVLGANAARAAIVAAGVHAGMDTACPQANRVSA